MKPTARAFMALFMGLLLLTACAGAKSPPQSTQPLVVDIAVPPLLAAPLLLPTVREQPVQLRFRRVSAHTAAADLRSGRAFAAVLDPITCLTLKNSAQVLAVLADRDGAAIVGRQSPPFIWSHLRTRTVLLDVDPSTELLVKKTTGLFGFPRAEAPIWQQGTPSAFSDGEGSFLVTDLTTALSLQNKGRGFLETRIGVETGPWPAALLVVGTAQKSHTLLLQWLVTRAAKGAIRIVDTGAPQLATALTKTLPHAWASPQALAQALSQSRRDEIFHADLRLSETLARHLQELAGKQAILPYVPEYADEAYRSVYAEKS